MTDEQAFSMWELGSGLPLDGARVHSTAAIFTYNQEYAKNAVVLEVTWQPWDGTNDSPDSEAQKQLYSVGQKWESLDGGNAVGHTSGKRQKFNDQTNIGRLITSYINGLGGGDWDRGLKAAMASGMEPDKASMWVGLDVTLGKVEYPLQTKDDQGNFKTGQTMAIAEYHGKAGAAAPATPATTASPASPAASTAAASTNGGGDDPAGHLGQKLYRQLKKLAVDSADHDAFMDAAFLMDDVTSDDKAWNKATERIIMEYGPDSLFTTARS